MESIIEADVAAVQKEKLSTSYVISSSRTMHRSHLVKFKSCKLPVLRTHG
jgi:hypothetical protein